MYRATILYKRKKKLQIYRAFQTYTVFLSCFISLFVNSQRTSKKARFGGAASGPLSRFSNGFKLKRMPSLEEEKKNNNVDLRCTK